jgi:uncharacterized membrane protein
VDRRFGSNLPPPRPTASDPERSAETPRSKTMTVGQDDAERSHGPARARSASPDRDRAPTLPPGRGETVTRLSQAVRVARIAAPLHPIFVHFSIALTAASFVFDAMAWLFGFGALAAVGWWTLAAAIVVTPLTIATGFVSRLRLPIAEGETRSFLRAHMALGPSVFGCMLAVAVWRAMLWDADAGVSGWYLLAMAGVLLLTTAQGYLGGELVYRYGAEVKFLYRAMPGRRQPFPRPWTPVRKPPKAPRANDNRESA